MRTKVNRKVARPAGCQTQRRAGAACLAVALATACASQGRGPAGDDERDSSTTPSPAIDAGGEPACGLSCLFDLAERAPATCDPDDVAALDAAAAPAWYAGRALFVSRGRSVAIAGSFNGWDAGALATAPVCGTGLHIALADVASGRHEYKIVADQQWSLDPLNAAFAYDEFAGNADGRNSVLNTYDSGLGHLVATPEPLCSDALGRCGALQAYLPPGYTDPAHAGRVYPVVYMHDGQNVFDDQDCCFGHTGWEINVTLDQRIASGEIGELIAVGFDHGGPQRIAEYGVPDAEGGKQDSFAAFQIDTVQPTAEARWRIDPGRRYTAGSSLGGVIAFRLALARPDVYRGAASLSGAFWIGDGSIGDMVKDSGQVPVALYVDHGGTAADGGDNYGANVDLVEVLADAGWQLSDSPACATGADSLCYFHDAGAQHDELAWRARAWRFLRFFAPPM